MRKRSRAALIMTYTIVLGITLSVLIFFTYTLVLRTDYKSTALEINDAILSGCNMTISRGEDTFPATQETADYYNRFLLLQTDAFSRRSVPVTDKSIILRIGDNELSFTGLEDNSAIAVKWKTAADDKNYIVRSQITFLQLSAYFSNNY